MPTQPTPEQVDALLPQTQCGLCGYGGCMPYAKALVMEKAPINLCPPGGVTTLQQLGILLNQEVQPFIAEMQQKQKPQHIAIIREAECIGCTKCIQACPVDAIFGSAKQMHTVIASECTGCELCIAPCPVDCIEMIALDPPPPALILDEKNHRRERYHAREARLKQLEKPAEQEARASNNKQDYLRAALARGKR